MRDELGRNALTELGDAMADAKKTAPTHPHPRSPDTSRQPRGGAAAGVVDRVGDTVSGVAQGSVLAVQDLIARITGSERPQVSPTGSSAARKLANEIRSQNASTAADGVKATARSAKSGAKSYCEGRQVRRQLHRHLGEEVDQRNGDDACQACRHRRPAAPPRSATKTDGSHRQAQCLQDGSRRTQRQLNLRVGNPVTQPPEVARRAAGAVDEPGRLRQRAEFLRGRVSGQVWRRTVDDTWPAFRHHQRVEAPAQTTCTDLLDVPGRDVGGGPLT